MMHKSIIAGLIFAVATIILPPIAGANTPQEVRVALFQAHAQIQSVIIRGPLEILQPIGRTVNAPTVTFRRVGERIEAVIGPGTSSGITPFAVSARFVVRANSGVTTVVPAGMHSRSYKGKIVIAMHPDGGSHLVTPSPRGLYLTNVVPSRDYVKSVVGSETNPGFAGECLKAQSVLAQTVLDREGNGQVILDTTQSQAYLGYDAVRPDIDAAVDATWGTRLMFHGKPIIPYYHSTCAGGTSDGKQYFALKGDLPYLKGTVCSYCKDSPFWKTTSAVVPFSVWQTKIGTAVPTVLEKDNRKRPTSIRLGGKLMSGYLFWLQLGQKLGWDKAPGTRFDIWRQGSNVVITSTGAGHGVGLCQWGANGLARRGKSFRDILGFYFPGTELKTPQSDQ